MFGVKVTIASIIFTLLMMFAIKILVGASSIKTKLLIMTNQNLPKWYQVLCVITTLLFLVDVVGIIYSVLFILFA